MAGRPLLRVTGLARFPPEVIAEVRRLSAIRGKVLAVIGETTIRAGGLSEKQIAAAIQKKFRIKFSQFSVKEIMAEVVQK